jgi:tetratricopeptide (TPR) repeat protein
MNISKLSGVSLFLLTMALLFLSGCGSQKSLFKSSSDKHYERMLEQQKLKAAASEDPVPLEKIPENDPKAFEQMGDMYLRKGNLDMAFIQYGKALRIDPDRLGTRQKVGHLYLKKGLGAEALNEFNTILVKDKRNVAALQGKATALVQLNRLSEAEQVLRETIAIDEKAWQAYLLLGSVYDRQKQYEDAVVAYRKAVTVNPKSASAYNNLGVSLFLMRKYQESAEALLSAISIDPSNQQSYNNLGLSLFKLGKYPEALETFKKGGDEASSYNNMGVLYMEEKKYEEAIEYFEKAIEAKPSYYESAHAGMRRAKAGLDQRQKKPDPVQPSAQP